jgi:Tfp pilus assembly protein PilF
VTEYQKAIQCDEECAEAYGALGELYHKQNRIEEAENMYKLALSYKPQLVTIRVNYGTLLMDQTRFSEAREMFSSALQYTNNQKLRDFIMSKLG